MNLIVTGASGFIGRGLVERLSATGHGGVATGRDPPVGVPPGWRAVSRESVLHGAVEADAVEAIIHLEVRQHIPRPTTDDIQSFYDTNVAGTRQWLDWADRHHVRRFVFTSSIKAVPAGDAAERVAVNGSPGSGAAEPDTAYGRSKASAEAAVRDWAAARPDRIAVILRPAPVYGPGNGANLAAFARQVVAGKPCLIGLCDARKSVVSRTNLVAAIEFAAEWKTVGCEVFNVSDRDTFSLGQLADMISTLAGAPKPRRVPRPLAGCAALLGDAITAVTGRDFPLTTARMKQMLATSVFSCSKLTAAGFEHPQTTEQGLEEMLEWMKQNHAFA
jgi:nucleoside-diphosphate-sugar epimerase